MLFPPCERYTDSSFYNALQSFVKALNLTSNALFWRSVRLGCNSKKKMVPGFCCLCIAWLQPWHLWCNLNFPSVKKKTAKCLVVLYDHFRGQHVDVGPLGVGYLRSHTKEKRPRFNRWMLSKRWRRNIPSSECISNEDAWTQPTEMCFIGIGINVPIVM